jgi:hypothetical protein
MQLAHRQPDTVVERETRDQRVEPQNGQRGGQRHHQDADRLRQPQEQIVDRAEKGGQGDQDRGKLQDRHRGRLSLAGKFARLPARRRFFQKNRFRKTLVEGFSAIRAGAAHTTGH